MCPGHRRFHTLISTVPSRPARSPARRRRKSSSDAPTNKPPETRRFAAHATPRTSPGHLELSRRLDPQSSPGRWTLRRPCPRRKGGKQDTETCVHAQADTARTREPRTRPRRDPQTPSSPGLLDQRSDRQQRGPYKRPSLGEEGINVPSINDARATHGTAAACVQGV